MMQVILLVFTTLSAFVSLVQLCYSEIFLTSAPVWGYCVDHVILVSLVGPSQIWLS